MCRQVFSFAPLALLTALTALSKGGQGRGYKRCLGMSGFRGEEEEREVRSAERRLSRAVVLLQPHQHQLEHQQARWAKTCTSTVPAAATTAAAAAAARCCLCVCAAAVLPAASAHALTATQLTALPAPADRRCPHRFPRRTCATRPRASRARRTTARPRPRWRRASRASTSAAGRRRTLS